MFGFNPALVCGFGPKWDDMNTDPDVLRLFSHYVQRPLNTYVK